MLNYEVICGKIRYFEFCIEIQHWKCDTFESPKREPLFKSLFLHTFSHVSVKHLFPMI